MRPLPALLVSSMLLLTACASDGNGDHFRRAPSYERTAGGALMGGVAGGVTGALCCGNPVSGTGAGILIGAILGAMIGAAIDATYPEK